MDSSPDTASTPSPAKGWPVHKERGADMVGELIDGHFKIIRRIAKGGMGDVFYAKDVTRKCHVAIKFLHSRGPESVRRFVVEGEVLSNIKHPNIVRAIAVGKMPEGQPYMALEYLAGEPLSRLLEHGAMPWRDAAAIMIQVAGAVHALHVAGIVHRDVKPANIMLTLEADRSIAHVIDLGVASVGPPYQDVQDAHFTPDPPSRHPTQLGHAIGTPAYLPPEAGHCLAEPRLDVFSLGVTLYQLCTQLLPSTTDSRPIRDVCPGSDAPDDLWRLLQAALAPDPAERLPSADHLRRGLEAILAAHPRKSSPRHLFGGSYDRLEVLGVGASAVVFRASDRCLSREVAVKVLRNAEPSEDDAIRFRRAAKVLSALRHENILRILHFGIHDEQTFAVTELCPGSPATDVVRPDNHLRLDEVLTVGVQLASALAAVHAAGIVYRDLHPGNVLIARGERPSAWIFDFDQAQVSSDFYMGLTERWATPPEERAEPKHEKPLQAMDYASPEVRAGAAFTVASDVYALGLLLYRLLTGKRPFPVSGGEPTPSRKLCSACPRGLEGLLLGMLRPAPDARPSLHMVQMTLEDEQAELAAELAEGEDGGAPDMAVKPSTAGGVQAPEPVGSGVQAPDPGPTATTADTTVIAESTTAAIVTPTGTAAAAPTALTDSGASTIRADAVPGGLVTPHSRPRRALGLLGLALTVAVSVMIGRASVTRDDAGAADGHVTTLRTTSTSDMPDEPVMPVDDAAQRRETPPGPVKDDAPAVIVKDKAPPEPAEQWLEHEAACQALADAAPRAKAGAAAGYAAAANECRKAFETAASLASRSVLAFDAHRLYRRAHEAGHTEALCIAARMLRTFAAQLAAPGVEDRPNDRKDVGALLSAMEPALATCSEPAGPARPAKPETKRGPVTPASRAPQRGAVTVAEAKGAAQDAVPALRTCDGVPNKITADLDIVSCRGVVTALNSHAVAPDDPLYRWHGCARRTLEAVDFPKAETAGHARVRLTLR